MVAGKLSGDGDMREGALRNKNLYNFIFPLSTVGWSGSGMGVGRGRPKLLRWGEGGRCAIKLCTILFFRARRHDKAGGVLRRSPLKRPRRAMPRTARSAVLGFLGTGYVLKIRSSAVLLFWFGPEAGVV